MFTQQSQLIGKTRREGPEEAEAISHSLLVRAGYIDQLASGIFSLLPLGYLAISNIEKIIGEEMRAIGAAEVSLPAMQPAGLWRESGRLDTMDPPLFRLEDRHGKDMVLGSTHEEVMTDLARKHIESYKDMPLACFQIQTKFRNEMRATSGLLRLREFRMKDLYSFHRDGQDLAEFYSKAQSAYENIFSRCGLKVYPVVADSGTIGGSLSNEFMTESEVGEDKVGVCPKCGYAANLEVIGEDASACPECKATLEIKTCIENAHIFQLGTTYSEKMGAMYVDEDGSKKPIMMGCYGIGIERLLATIVETHHDDKGMKWPQEISPFAVHVTPLQNTVMDAAQEIGQKIAEHVDVLIDDRDLSAGEKLAEADLLGMSTRIIVSEKTQEKGEIEVTQRADGASEMVSVDDFIGQLT